MPTLEQNLRIWNVTYKWPNQGEGWSRRWGGSEPQWFSAIFPRIHAYVPAATILEIAPGYGRWTEYLKNWADHLIVVDMADKCIEACQQRFASESNIAYHINDGKSLAMLADRSIDFVFSFDSLVHAEVDVIRAYLNQLARKLKPNGAGFIHHSNMGQYRRYFSISERIPHSLRASLTRTGILDRTHGRDFSMTARLFEQYCEEAGLQCVSQELVNWGTKRLIDCFSVFTPKGSSWARLRSNEIVRNPNFMKEADLIRRLSPLYSRTGGKTARAPVGLEAAACGVDR
jgi:ubiquinone/menaquinone biosynthesis C-methylase UbiE